MKFLVITCLLLIQQSALARPSGLTSPVQQLVAKELVTRAAIIAKIRKVDSNGNNDLHLAANLKEFPLEEALFLDLTTKNTGLAELIRTEYINATNGYGQTPLQRFTFSGDIDVVRTLIDAGADANKGHPLATASVRSRTEIAKLLIDAGADVNAIERSNSTYSILQFAVIHGRTDIVEILIDAGVDVNATSLSQTALYTAIDKNRLKIAKLLIDAGADVNATNGPSEQTALHRAVFKERTEMIKLLIDAGADVNINDKNGRRVLESFAWLTKHKKAVEITKLILDAGYAPKDGRYPR